MLFEFLAVIILLVIGSWVVPGPTNKPALVAEFVWFAPLERLTPEGRELAFPEFCCPPLALGGANVTKEFVLLGLGGGNVPFVPRGVSVVVDPIMANPDDGNVAVGVGAKAWALLMGVPPAVVVVALTAVATRGRGTTIGVLPGVVAFALAATAMAATSLLGGGEGGLQHRSVAWRELGLINLWRMTR
jgi:hypothetical protein